MNKMSNILYIDALFMFLKVIFKSYDFDKKFIFALGKKIYRMNSPNMWLDYG